jgi:GntR family transcriptional regulator
MIERGDVPVYRQLAGLLRDQIRSGQISPRTPIPSKRALRQEHGVSGGTVDKAVHLLREEHLVRTVPGLGIFVTDPRTWKSP